MPLVTSVQSTVRPPVALVHVVGPSHSFEAQAQVTAAPPQGSGAQCPTFAPVWRITQICPMAHFSFPHGIGVGATVLVALTGVVDPDVAVVGTAVVASDAAVVGVVGVVGVAGATAAGGLAHATKMQDGTSNERTRRAGIEVT